MLFNDEAEGARFLSEKLPVLASMKQVDPLRERGRRGVAQDVQQHGQDDEGRDETGGQERPGDAEQHDRDSCRPKPAQRCALLPST